MDLNKDSKLFGYLKDKYEDVSDYLDYRNLL